MTVTEQFLLSIKAFFPLCPHGEQAEDGQEFGGDIAGKTDPIWPKGYSITCDVLLSNKSSVKGGEGKYVHR